jgi:lysozyme
VEVPLTTRATGIDISSYQGAPDWNKVKTANLSFCFIKSSEGNGYRANYLPQWEGAGSIGLLRSCYHYHIGVVPGNTQADYFMDYATQGELPPVIDFEDSAGIKSGISGAQMFRNLQTYLKRIEAYWHVKPIIYTGYWFIWMCQQSSPDYNYQWMTEYPLWIANYTQDPTGEPYRPDGWPWKFYQYSSKGAVPGIEGRVDMDVYNGTVDELRAWAGVGEIKPPEPSIEERLTALEKRVTNLEKG